MQMHIQQNSNFEDSARLPHILDLRIVLLAIKDSWRLIAAAGTASACLFFAASFLIHNTYRATALILPPEQSGSSLGMLSALSGGASLPSGALASLGIKNQIDLYVALMSTPSVEDAVIAQFNLQSLYKCAHLSQARKKFESNLLIKPDEKSGLISISVVDRDPNRAAQMANAIIAAYDALSGHLAITDAARRRAFFERQLGDTKQNLAKAEDNLRDTIKRTGIMEPEGNARAMIGYQEQLRAQITAKNAELQSMRTYLADENPQVQAAQRERNSLESQASALNNSGGDVSNSKSMASDASLAYTRALREVRYNEALFELMMKNLELAKLDEAREGNLVQIVEAAQPPDMKYAPHRSIFMTGGALLGLLLSSAWVLIQKFCLTVSQERRAE